MGIKMLIKYFRGSSRNYNYIVTILSLKLYTCVHTKGLKYTYVIYMCMHIFAGNSIDHTDNI